MGFFNRQSICSRMFSDQKRKIHMYIRCPVQEASTGAIISRTTNGEGLYKLCNTDQIIVIASKELLMHQQRIKISINLVLTGKPDSAQRIRYV